MVDYSIRKEWKRFRLVDPLDGTRDFIAKNDDFYNSEKVERLIRENQIKKSAEIDSALKFCCPAKGNINLYPRFSGSMEWDIGAGHMILKKANCGIFELNSNRLEAGGLFGRLKSAKEPGGKPEATVNRKHSAKAEGLSPVVLRQ